jgi:hypothetical protein
LHSLTAIPLTHTRQDTITEKQHNYQELTLEIRQQWQLNKIPLIPLVFSATGVTPNMLNQSFTTLNLPPRLLFRFQRAVVPNTCSMGRKHLNNEVRLHDEEIDNP